MTYLLLRSLKQANGFKICHSSFLNIQYPLFKKVYMKDSHVLGARNFSWAGFYTALSQSTPVVSLQNMLLDIHGITGLPWWVVIMLTTFGIRSLIVFPLTVHQHQVISRLANINAGMDQTAAELNKEINVARRIYNLSGDQCKTLFKKQMRKIYNDSVVRDNCHPFKTTLLILIQIPVWVCFSVSLRNLTLASSFFNPSIKSEELNFKNEGILWFTDLTCPDPVVIPLMLMLVNLSLIEIHAMKLIGPGNLFQKILLNGSRIITILIAVAAAVNPSSVTFYWLCSSIFGLGQNLLLMSPKVRRALRIPKTGKECATPFSNIFTNIKKRLKR